MSRRPNIPRQTPNPTVARARADAAAKREAAASPPRKRPRSETVEVAHVPAGLDADGATVAAQDRRKALRVMRLVFAAATGLLLCAGAGLVVFAAVAVDGTVATIVLAAAGVVLATVAATVGVVASQRVRAFAATGEVPRKPTL